MENKAIRCVSRFLPPISFRESIISRKGFPACGPTSAYTYIHRHTDTGRCNRAPRLWPFLLVWVWFVVRTAHLHPSVIIVFGLLDFSGPSPGLRSADLHALPRAASYVCVCVCAPIRDSIIIPVQNVVRNENQSPRRA